MPLGPAASHFLSLSHGAPLCFQMLGVEELRRGQGGGGGESGQGDASVSAPKIARFCEEHLDLVGRLVASRLMFELSPFMDSSVAGTAAAPTESARAELVATRRKLDEVKGSSRRLKRSSKCHRRFPSAYVCFAVVS